MGIPNRFIQKSSRSSDTVSLLGLEYREIGRSVQDVAKRTVNDRAPAMSTEKIALPANQLPQAPVADRRLALMVQDMAAFGRRGGENELSRRRETTSPVDYFG